MAVLAVILTAFAGLVSLHTPKAIGAPSGEQLFRNNCAACHAGGGNIVDPKKPLKGSKKLTSKDTLSAYLLKPTGSMAPFPKIVGDAPALEALYQYCKTLK